MRSTRIVGGVAAVVAVAVLIPTTGHATPILDQSFEAAPFNLRASFGLVIFPNVPTVEIIDLQSFTVGLAGVLTSVEIYIGKHGAPDQNAIVEIVPTADALGGSALATAFLTPSGVPTGTASFVSVDLSGADLLVTVGEKLSIRLTSLDNLLQNVNEYFLDGNFPGGYAGGVGQQFSTGNNGGYQDLGDFYFRTFVDDPSDAVPEPSTLALFGFGLLGLGALYRRRKVKA